nr:class I poly(R)-hydroxyalkanoic acid synthase [uncultured Cohaesibacter sp.]
MVKEKDEDKDQMGRDPEDQPEGSSAGSAGFEQGFTQFMIQDPEKFATNIAHIFEEAGKVASAYLRPRESGVNRHTVDYVNQMVRTFGEVTQHWTSDPQRTLEAQTRLWGRCLDLWGASSRRMMGEQVDDIASPATGDLRFDDPDWQTNPFFSFLRQLYLIASQWASEMVVEADSVDEHTRHKALFYVNQIFNALSPSNYVLTNPTLLRETLENNGENLIRGMQMLAEDIQAGGGNLLIRQTDASVFRLGDNIAVTPGEVVAQNDICQLIQYEAQTETVQKTPLLIFAPWINKYYILDLNERKSFIQWCVRQGHTVFAVSWVNPDETLKDKDFADYMREGILSSIETVRQITGEEKVNTLGYCVGGTLLSAAMAYLAAKDRDWINSATLIAAQVDFAEAGDLKVFIDEDQLAELEKVMDRQGYLDGQSMANVFNMLQPNDLIWPYFVNNYMRGLEPFPFDLLFWNQDSTRMTAACHSYYLRKCYLENALSDGTMELDGVQLDLASIKAPVYCLALREDHIAPARSVYNGARLFGGSVDFVLGGSGHIAGVVNPPVLQKYQFWRGDTAEGSLEDWLDKASATPGSWWPDWHEWLVTRSGGKVPARRIGSLDFPPMESAPGTYARKVY